MWPGGGLDRHWLQRYLKHRAQTVPEWARHRQPRQGIARLRLPTTLTSKIAHPKSQRPPEPNNYPPHTYAPQPSKPPSKPSSHNEARACPHFCAHTCPAVPPQDGAPRASMGRARLWGGLRSEGGASGVGRSIRTKDTPARSCDARVSRNESASRSTRRQSSAQVNSETPPAPHTSKGCCKWWGGGEEDVSHMDGVMGLVGRATCT